MVAALAMLARIRARAYHTSKENAWRLRFSSRTSCVVTRASVATLRHREWRWRSARRSTRARAAASASTPLAAARLCSFATHAISRRQPRPVAPSCCCARAVLAIARAPSRLAPHAFSRRQPRRAAKPASRAPATARSTPPRLRASSSRCHEDVARRHAKSRSTRDSSVAARLRWVATTHHPSKAPRARASRRQLSSARAALSRRAHSFRAAAHALAAARSAPSRHAPSACARLRRCARRSLVRRAARRKLEDAK